LFHGLEAGSLQTRAEKQQSFPAEKKVKKERAGDSGSFAYKSTNEAN
jgi:hypothetical protein